MTFSTYVRNSLRWNALIVFSACLDVIVQISQLLRKIGSMYVLKAVIFVSDFIPDFLEFYYGAINIVFHSSKLQIG